MMFILFTLFFLASCGGAGIWIAARIRRQRIEDEQSALRFQRAMEQEFKGKVSPEAFAEPSPAAEAAPTVFPEPIPAAPSPPVIAPRLSSATGTQRVIDLLREGGLLVRDEGACLPMDESGQCILVRLRRDKTALLVPRHESDYFLSRALKRYDYVILIPADDRVMVISKYQDFIAGQF